MTKKGLKRLYLGLEYECTRGCFRLRILVLFSKLNRLQLSWLLSTKSGSLLGALSIQLSVVHKIQDTLPVHSSAGCRE